MLSESRTCPACERRLSEGVPDVFCPECALRQALAAGVAAKPTMTEGKAQQFDLAAPRPAGRESKSVTPPAPRAGDVIEDYEILEKVGGNMGSVYKARHRLLNKIVALKLFPAEWISDGARLARFEREIRAMGQLAHPNLVTAADARSVNSWRLVVMEWIDGIDLQAAVQTHGPLPIEIACELIRQAAVGLQYAHDHGLIHRDIKPSNLMLTRSGSVKVIDMGLALAREETVAQVTHPGALLGTMHYCAPEQLRDASTVDSRADVYSLGCALYHLLAGKPPFAHRKNFAELVHAHVSEPFPSVKQARPDVPDELAKTIDRMTAKDPSQRFESTTDVAQALEPFARGANLSQLLAPKTQPLPARRIDPTMTPITAEPVARIEHPQRSRGRWMALAASVLLIASALGAFVFFQRDPAVVLMDTTAAGGVYDDDVRAAGGSNAGELAKVLKPLLPHSLSQVTLDSTFAEEEQVLAKNPSLVIIHRSSFYHSLNAFFNVKTNDVTWRPLYDAGDERVKSLIGYLGTCNPQTKFLVYSRGTDPTWLKANKRKEWVETIENRFPRLRGRITTMVITGGDKAGSFRNEETILEMRTKVKEILHLRNKN
ncbi:MAG TPA: serine/threonine-protein kinase [Verrucomicrobiae bacterium]|nr:serine/threonine-protein kinase [Verrucomicrobiae bacterium]